uniref:Uncharacterized protein n=1 Tax=Arundo donax TaxID=35708 RepID=A0A0A9FYY2_ARUDO
MVLEVYRICFLKLISCE